MQLKQSFGLKTLLGVWSSWNDKKWMEQLNPGEKVDQTKITVERDFVSLIFHIKQKTFIRIFTGRYCLAFTFLQSSDGTHCSSVAIVPLSRKLDNCQLLSPGRALDILHCSYFENYQKHYMCLPLFFFSSTAAPRSILECGQNTP